MNLSSKARLYQINTAKRLPDNRFEEIFLHHLDTLFRMSLRLARNRADAEDILQEALLKAYTHFDQLKDPSKARPWLFQILVNTFRNAISKRRREPPIIDVDINEDLVRSSLQTPSYDPLDVFDRLMEDEVDDALNELHPEFKVVILLFDVEGLSYDEIAEVCQCSKGTVASRLYRAREILRVKLEVYARKHGYV